MHQRGANAPRHALRQDRRRRAGYQPWPDTDPWSAWRKISPTRLSPTPASSRLRNHFNRAKVEIPIDHRRNPAGSCLGGFRTPAPCPDARAAMAGVRKPSPRPSLSCRLALLRSRRSRRSVEPRQRMDTGLSTFSRNSGIAAIRFLTTSGPEAEWQNSSGWSEKPFCLALIPSIRVGN
jgi:hypothetical protein